jgi:hypothetical protein
MSNARQDLADGGWPGDPDPADGARAHSRGDCADPQAKELAEKLSRTFKSGAADSDDPPIKTDCDSLGWYWSVNANKHGRGSWFGPFPKEREALADARLAMINYASVVSRGSRCPCGRLWPECAAFAGADEDGG